MSSMEILSDYSKTGLKEVPEKILEMTNLKMLFLERNQLEHLPENFFSRLPNLMWLDLRDNKLEEIPTSIVHHEHLENLLLTNNNLKKLPNELGLVPNLKALQVANNPLEYPPKKIIIEGTKAVKNFLQQQYDIEHANNVDKIEEINTEEFNNPVEPPEEKVLKVYRMTPPSKESIYHKIIEHPNPLSSTLRVKKIEIPRKQDEPMKIVHSVNKSNSRISLKSYFSQPETKGNLERIPEDVLKEGWLNKLRILLNDQEMILQQERQRKRTPPKTFSDLDYKIPETPYATYPEYSRIPSRSELANGLNAFLGESRASRRPISREDLDKVINDLVQQLREMDNMRPSGSPRTDVEFAGQQIDTILDIHKKLLKLKTTNCYL